MDWTKPIEPNWQMKRLRDMLDMEGVAWHDASDLIMARTHSDEWGEYVDGKGRRHERRVFSVVCGPHAYGGTDGLEAWLADEEEPCGYATAEEVMERIREVVA